MKLQLSSGRSGVAGLVFALLVAGAFSLATGAATLLTPDQRGHRLYEQGRYSEAAAVFADSQWKGVALFKQGEFKQSAGIFAGNDTAESAFNYGNALVMQGQYDSAAEKYARALELAPGWDAATINLEIALARAAMLKREGGDMTGGMLGADDVVFSEGESPPSAGEDQVVAAQDMSDAELRAVWLRQVQTKPADFLQAKFAYQLAVRQLQDGGQEVAR